MIPAYTENERRARLGAAGLDAEAADRFLSALRGVELSAVPDPARLAADAAAVEPIFARGWGLCDALPPKSARTPAERAAGETLVHLMAELCRRFSRTHREAMYRRLTDDYRTPLRIDELVWKAAELWPGLLPARQQVERERDRKQMDKDGLEIQQGVFLGQVMAEPRAGNHLIVSMLRPKRESLELLATFQKQGQIDLGLARAEVRGGIGYVTTSNPRFLNAEDDACLGPQETAIDLVLLHPDVQLCVLRGGVVEHPRYRGRRVFDSGINLTKLYHGQIGYVSFYLVRDLGLVNKIYRGLALDGWQGGDEPEETTEKPWIAAVDAFAIGGGCQLLLVVDYVIAESGSYCNLPARKEGIIPGAANLRLPRFMGDRMAREAILFDRTFDAGSPEAAALINEVAPRDGMDQAVERAAANALGSGMVSAGGNRKALRVEQEPIDTFRRYLATYCAEQAFCHLSPELIVNLEKHWHAKERAL